jgi:hypothetical protein
MLQAFYLDVAYVTMTMLQVYISNVSSILVLCCSCFIAKSRSQHRVVSEEERDSAGAMTLFVVSWWQRSTGGRTGIRAGVRGSFPYDMLPLLALPLEQKLVVSPRATEM